MKQAIAGGEEGVNGAWYAGGQFLPDHGQSAAVAAKPVRPQRYMALLADVEVNGLPHGKAWVYSYRREERACAWANVDTMEGRREWDKQMVCYVYPEPRRAP